MKNVAIYSTLFLLLPLVNWSCEEEKKPVTVQEGIEKRKGIERRIVKTGEEFTIKLPSNLKDRYSWQLVPTYSPTKLKLIKDREFIRAKPPIPGGYDTFIFQALKPGDATITLEYTPWKLDKPVTKKHLVVVGIK